MVDLAPSQLLLPPIPSDVWASARIEHQRLRRRLLYGLWFSDLATRMVRNLGWVRASQIGDPDMSANPYEAMCAQASALYDRVPKISQPDAPSLAAMQAWTTKAMLYPQMQRVQRDVLGMRELFLRVGVSLGPNGVPSAAYTPAFADMVLPVQDPKDPNRPIAIDEYVDRPDPRNPSRTIWTRDHWSIDGIPEHRVLSGDGKVDLSEHYGLPPGGLRGPDYPAIRLDGVPILPYATYHAAVTGSLLDPYYRAELIQGVLNVGVLWTYFVHTVEDASWPQRWISGGFIAGAQDGGDGTRRVVADPATILELLRDPDFEGPVQAGQWASGSDPLAVAQAIGVYEERFTRYVEVASEFWRRNADPRSGLALTLDRTGRIEAQRKYSPIFAPVDAEVLSITAVLTNRLLGAPLVAEDGWKVEHVALQAPLEQRKDERDEALAMLGAGLASRAEARARITGEDLDAAKEAIAAIDRERIGPIPQVQPPDPTRAL